MGLRRQIKFRGKRIDSGEWVYGYYIEMGLKHFICNPITMPPEIFFFKKRNGEQINAVSGMFSPMYEVDPATVGQFIDRLDRNKKEIYEGDMCKNGDWVPDANAYSYREEDVRWDKGSAMWIGWNYNEDGMTCEVIGDIHSNPELLEN